MNELLLFLIIEYLLMVSNSGQCKCNKVIGHCFMPVGAHCCKKNFLVNGSELYLNAILYKMGCTTISSAVKLFKMITNN